MGKPTPYSASVLVPLPNDSEVARIIGDAYDPDTALNVLKMMSGTGDLFPALIGMVQAIFGEPDIDAKHRRGHYFACRICTQLPLRMAGQRADGQKRRAHDR